MSPADMRVLKLYRYVRGAPMLVRVAPLETLPYPEVDVAGSDPIGDILGSPEFRQTSALVERMSQSRALVSADAQSLLYCLVRNLVPDAVLEIGTYKAATTEVIARALELNNHGVIHTVDPFHVLRIRSILACWPSTLRKRVRYHACDSMSFFWDARKMMPRPGLVFIDGNHQYEFALFDLQAAASLVVPGGYVVLDNVSQLGPFQAVLSFLDAHRSWALRVPLSDDGRTSDVFDPERTTVPGTDLAILRAPAGWTITSTPSRVGDFVLADGTRWPDLEIEVGAQVSCELKLEGVYRTFGDTPHEYPFVQLVSVSLAPGRYRIALRPDVGANAETRQIRRTIELWMSVTGGDVVELRGVPTITNPDSPEPCAHTSTIMTR